jgi:hypothetical protein
MKFYLPNFEDLVDPEYDFIRDEFSPWREQRGRFNHDWYAHQFFDQPIFDGMLISKTIVTARLRELIERAGGVHAFCRLDRSIPIMGDCGAFSYRNKERPPYEVGEILDYYETLGFTEGVSIDHLIFASMPRAEREYRLEITLDNAREFISLHESLGCSFTPVGIAQGWDPISRRQAVEQLLDMGYKNLALGGMARSSDKDLRQTLEAISPALSKGFSLHIFGVARLSMIPDFVRFGVTSADSASPLRRAFLGTSDDNYWTRDGRRYAAIRVPEVRKGAPTKRGIHSTEEIMEKNGVSLDVMKRLEETTLTLLRNYHTGAAGPEETLQAVLKYDRLHGDKRDHKAAYRRVLQERPWQQCGCPICEEYGVEVIIFRGNNRNRRRGFHNVSVFYDRFRELVKDCQEGQSQEVGSRAVQLTLNLDSRKAN